MCSNLFSLQEKIEFIKNNEYNISTALQVREIDISKYVSNQSKNFGKPLNNSN
jgi:hypothetical protein